MQDWTDDDYSTLRRLIEKAKNYAKITEGEVLRWVWGSVGKAETEKNLGEQIQAHQDMPHLAGAPWA